jgi:putative spermidine/putrescine transport system permease protein
MAALGSIEKLGSAAMASAGAPSERSVWRARVRWWRGLVLGVVGLYFVVPLFAAFRFCVVQPSGKLSLSAFTSLLAQQGFAPAFELSLRLVLVTCLITVVLVVPTSIYVHVRCPALRQVMDVVTTLPIVIPPIVLVLGVLGVSPAWLKASPYLLSLEYVVMGLPFAYRSLDAGLRSFDHATLVDASRSLGGGWLTTLFRVLLPELRTAILSATLLTVALVLGEYTMASLDQYETFPVWMVNFDQSNSARVSVAASLMSLVVTWLLLLVISYLGGNRRRQRWRRALLGFKADLR